MNPMTTEQKQLAKYMIMNRQPTLWRHSAPAVKIVPTECDDYVIGVSPLTLAPLNMD